MGLRRSGKIFYPAYLVLFEANWERAYTPCGLIQPSITRFKICNS